MCSNVKRSPKTAAAPMIGMHKSQESKIASVQSMHAASKQAQLLAASSYAAARFQRHSFLEANTQGALLR
jgi:hypothetical protein